MKLASIGPNAVFHRYLTPRWAHLPTSGAGAAIDGGRFNRPGIEALYLSKDPQTALQEYRQGASIAPPGTLAAFKVSLSKVSDLSNGYEPALWEPTWQEWSCHWRHIARIHKRTPPSWLLADQVIKAGFQGILFPSLQHAGGTNLVVFPSNFVPGDKIEVHDPASLLPRNQLSWL